MPLHHLRSAGVSLLLELSADGRLPVVRHWGADLGSLDDDDLAAVALAGRAAAGDSPFDVADDVAVLPEHAQAWTGRPGIEGSRHGRDWSPALRVREHGVVNGADGTQRLLVRAGDPTAYLDLTLEIELTAQGLVRERAMLINRGAEEFTLGAVRLTLPVPPVARELMDFTGRHTMERVPQRSDFTLGVHAREGHTGRPGLDSAHVLLAGEPGFSFGHGQVWGIHVGWSGNQTGYAEALPNGARSLGGGERLEHGEVRLGQDESYTSPWLYAAHGVGTDELAARFHGWLRARAGHPRRARPVILNTWEAVYFEQDLASLTALADLGARVGCERFVLDDGWFAGRRDDTTSLGDWRVSAEVWPDGLDPLVSHVHGLGMEFGLWVEPEMVNLDSDLARAHPEWLFSAGGRRGLDSRHQQVLDLGHDGALAHVREQLLALLERHDIASLKWDHNRALNDAGHHPGGEPGVHAHTLAAYRLMDELRERHPGLEIESCAGGGGRIDLGVLQRTDRVWASDCIDALERQQIQRWTGLLLPPELVGTHLGAPRAHTTGRTHDLSFRAETAIWGHLGIEWDLRSCTSGELDQVAAWVAFHRAHRELLHTGTVLTLEPPDDALWGHGVVALDRSEALYSVTCVRRTVPWPVGRLRLPGLDPNRRYAVSVPDPAGTGPTAALPPWAVDGVTMTGRALALTGLQPLPLLPEHSHLLHLKGTDA